MAGRSIRVSDSIQFEPGSATEAANLFNKVFQGLEAQAKKAGSEVIWDTLELEVEENEERSMMGTHTVHRQLYVNALAVTS